MDQSLRAGNVVGVDASLHVASPTCRERHSEFKSNEGPMITPHLVLDPFQWILTNICAVWTYSLTRVTLLSIDDSGF